MRFLVHLLCLFGSLCIINPAGDYMFKVNNINTRASCKICSKLTIKTPERRQASSVSIVNYE